MRRADSAAAASRQRGGGVRAAEHGWRGRQRWRCSVAWERWPWCHRCDGLGVEPDAHTPARELLGCTLLGVELSRRRALWRAAPREATRVLRGASLLVRLSFDGGEEEMVVVRVGRRWLWDDDLWPAASGASHQIRWHKALASEAALFSQPDESREQREKRIDAVIICSSRTIQCS
jgi:hypothetical protein